MRFFAGGDHHTLGLALDGEIDQLAFEGPVEIPLIVGHVLEMPDQLAGVGIERQRGVGVERIVVDARFFGRMHQRARCRKFARLRRRPGSARDRSCRRSTPKRRCVSRAADRSSCCRRAHRDARWCRSARLPCRWRHRAPRSCCRRAPGRRFRSMTLPLATSGPPVIITRGFLIAIQDLVIPGHFAGFHVERDDVQV